MTTNTHMHCTNTHTQDKHADKHTLPVFAVMTLHTLCHVKLDLLMWHPMLAECSWTEKDCTAWAKQRLGQLFDGLVLVDGPKGKVTATGTKAVEGDATLNVRKGKLVPVYEVSPMHGKAVLHQQA